MAPLQAILEKCRTQPPNILATLQAVQSERGFVDLADVPLIAQSLGVTDSDVHGVLSFYHDLRTEPPGRRQIRFCLGDSCVAMKAEECLAALEKSVKCRIGETSKDGKVSLDKVYCLGNCAHSPAMMVDGEVHGNLTPRTVAASASARVSVVPSRTKSDGPRFFVSNDVSAISAGADRVAAALAKKGATVVRTSSRGAFFLEPLVEVDGPDGRVGWTGATEKDVANILAGKGAQPVDAIPFLKGQTRRTFARAGLIDPLSIEDFKSRGGFRGLEKALAMDPQKIIDEMKASGLRGRGGAAFPAGVKWQTTKDALADQKYVVANADEGDPGTYSDRMIMEGEPYRLIEGMTICARAVGATKGYIYARSEYPHGIRKLRAAIARATEAGWLGHKIQGNPFDFELEVFVGAGAYICGEETALLESLEGKRGMVRPKPPFPAIEGLHRKPTVVNNVITFATAPDILDRGGAWHASIGTEKSKGTMPLQLAGCVRQGGLVEVPFGVTLEAAIYEFGGGLPKGSTFKAVQVGGPLGSIFPEKLLKTPICFDEFAKAGGILGHGGIVVFDQDTNMVELSRHFMEFTADESCGKCTPCRVGSTRAKEILEQIRDGQGTPEDLETLKDLSDTMKMTSLCALGGLAPYPVLTALQYFPKEFERRRPGR